ncbi:MAG: hypothetical protein NZ480_08470 [Bdellovibrionaceae bacterium]|nr:hypothetical protein [Pseudobdellovibrionaceae bacterium]MDW8190546.1 SAM-dependent methyltransferase [Pseudobdellovibrionaceae bacterium]
MRFDVFLTKTLSLASRSKAQELIQSHSVRLLCDGREVAYHKNLFIDTQKHRWEVHLISPSFVKYVSRAGLKLEYALDHWNVPLTEKVVVDVGQATGGFTQVCLARGAAKVYGIEAGHGQLHPTLRQNPKVVAFEHLDVRSIVGHPIFKPLVSAVDLVTVDVSFISVVDVIDPILWLAPQSMLILVKPQFEIPTRYLTKKGIVKDQFSMESFLLQFKETLDCKIGTVGQGPLPTPVRGQKGNQEYFLYYILR